MKQKKQTYTPPCVEIIYLPRQLSLLETVSIQSTFDEWGEGEEIDLEITY